MEPTSPSGPEGPPQEKRRRWPLLAAVGVAAGALLVLLVVLVAVLTDDDGETAGRSSSGTTTGSADSAEPTDPTATDPGGTTTSTEPPGTTTSAPASPGSAIPDGVSTIGDDVPPGRYITTGIDGSTCEWARLGGPGGDSVIASETGVAHQAIVDILGTDAAFRSSGCGTWDLYTPPDPPPLTTIDQGDWVVGEQIAPGNYLAPQAPACTWTRASGFEHIPREVTQTERTNLALEGPYLVTLTAGERFTTKGCATWTSTR